MVRNQVQFAEDLLEGHRDMSLIARDVGFGLLPIMIAQHASDVPAVAGFCQRADITDEVGSSIVLARKHFGPTRIAVSVESDPADGDGWIAVDVFVAGEAASVREAYGTYVREWVATAPVEKQMLIRLIYNFV